MEIRFLLLEHAAPQALQSQYYGIPVRRRRPSALLFWLSRGVFASSKIGWTILSLRSPQRWNLSLWRSYSNLQIYVPQVDFILALKLLARRDRDEDDILALCAHIGVETREQAQVLVDRYATKEWQTECNLASMLDALF